jgi:cytochrome c biogenesis protein CcdA
LRNTQEGKEGTGNKDLKLKFLKFKITKMKKILLIAVVLLAMPAISLAQEKKSFQYFYADWCPHCLKVGKFFGDNGVYNNFNVEKLNFDDTANRAKLKNIFEQHGYGSSDVGIPAVIVDGKLITGDGPIIAYFKDNFQIQEQPKTENKNSIPIWALIGAAFADAFNPCALAVLILLLATVINLKGKNYALLSGFMFSLAIFISYMLMGVGVYHAISAFGVSYYVSVGIGILAIILGLANFKDVFWYGKGFIMEVPLSWRPKMQEIIKKSTGPWSAFGVGFLVSLFLVPCASGPYVVILGMLAEKVNIANTFVLLALYNLVFVSPMILITLAMYFFNTRMGKVEEWRKNNLRLLHAIAGTILLILGIYLIYSRLT